MARASEREKLVQQTEASLTLLASSRFTVRSAPLVVSRLCLRRLSPSVEARCPRVDVAEGGINWRERSSVALMISPRSRRRRQSSLGKPTLRISTYVRTRIIYDVNSSLPSRKYVCMYGYVPRAFVYATDATRIIFRDIIGRYRAGLGSDANTAGQVVHAKAR